MEEQTTCHKSALRQQRLDALLTSCQNEVLQQLIGPFGLTPALFNDIDGGNVTTTRNFEKGVVAIELDQARHAQWENSNNGGYSRKAYDSDLKTKRKARFQDAGSLVSAYTGKDLPRNGQTHFDHTVAVKKIETDSRANLYMSEKKRVAMANDKKNIKPVEASINQSMGDKDKREWADSERKKDKGKTNAESFNVDKQRLEKAVKEAEKHVSRKVLTAQLKKQGTELAITGAKEAGKNALRQALGVALHTFASHAFQELKRLFLHHVQGNFIDKLISAMARVLEKVKAKLRIMVETGVSCHRRCNTDPLTPE